MIERLLIKNSPAFALEQIELDSGFNVFSGASGAGKSLLMESILALFGWRESNAELIEGVMKLPFSLESWGIDSEEETVFSILKKEKARYFINAQTLSKKRISEIASGFVKHVSPKSAEELEPERLLGLIDSFIVREDSGFEAALARYEEGFKELRIAQSELARLEEEERRIEELKEFARFEIAKISEINPKIGEYEALMGLKKRLSKREKIQEACERVERFLEGEGAVAGFLELIGREAVSFEAGVAEVRALLEEERARLEELEDQDAEGLLDRLERLAELQRRYGGEKEALEHLSKRRAELEHYEQLSFSKGQLQKRLSTLQARVSGEAAILHQARVAILPRVEESLQTRLSALLLPSASLGLEAIALGEKGSDRVALRLGKAELKAVSSGEFNRLRLAILALEASVSKQLGVLILDEIDANLSGEESEGVAKVLKELADSYQVLAISHQPHMPSYAARHFLVKREAEGSHLYLLDRAGQVQEIARMVSGSEITPEALEFAKRRLGD